MINSASCIPLWAILSSLLAVPLILLSSRRPNLREFWTLAAAGVKLALVLSLVPGVLAGRVAQCRLWEIAPGIELALRADTFAIFFALIASSLWLVTSVYSIGYMRGGHETAQTRYFASFALSLSATLGVAFAANLLTFILFYELLTLATYPLVVHKETAEARWAGRKYLAYSLTAGLLLLLVTGWIFGAAGTVEFRPGGILPEGTFGDVEIWVLFALFLIGVGVKAGIMPLHSWLPDAMVAPTPVSALLHAVAVVKSGVFGVVRMAGFVFGPSLMAQHNLHLLLATAAGTTILLSSVLAIRQDSLKRRLAYSTIGHLSYIALGVAMLSPDGFWGGVYHMSTHAMMKITLFFCAGAIYVRAHKQRVSELDGIGRQMPVTMAAFSIASLGLIGVPPLGGFCSKWFLCVGSAQAGWHIALAILLLSGLLNAGYLLPIVYRAYFNGPKEKVPIQEASPWMVAPLALTAGLTVLLGVSPNLMFSFFELAHRTAAGAISAGATTAFAHWIP